MQGELGKGAAREKTRVTVSGLALGEHMPVARATLRTAAGRKERSTLAGEGVSDRCGTAHPRCPRCDLLKESSTLRPSPRRFGRIESSGNPLKGIERIATTITSGHFAYAGMAYVAIP